MSFQGQEFSQGMRQFVINLKQFFDEERTRRGFPGVWSYEQTARGLGIGEASVRRVVAEYNRNSKRVVFQKAKDRGRPELVISSEYLADIRKYIRSRNLHGQHISLDLIGEYFTSEHEQEFSASTIWRTLQRWGFTHGVGQRRSALKERDYVILARRRYLRQKRANRRADGSSIRPEVYLDETFVNRNHSSQFTWYWSEDGAAVNKPAGKGERVVIVNAITIDGWVSGAQLVFEANRRTGDYHGQMDREKFSRWFEDRLLPNIQPNSLIMFDNASYHNVVDESSYPRANSTREKLCTWLDKQEIPWSDDMLKTELYCLCRLKAPIPAYEIDKIAERAGHTILRTPQYHPELQPIETCWGVAKNYMARKCDYTLQSFRENLPRAFEQVTSKTCKGLLQKMAAEEDRYWREDEVIENCQDVIFEDGEYAVIS